MLADIGILEKGNAAEVGGVSAALRTNQNTSGFLMSRISNGGGVVVAKVPQ